MKKLIALLTILTMVTQCSLIVFAEDETPAEEPQETEIEEAETKGINKNQNDDYQSEIEKSDESINDSGVEVIVDSDDSSELKEEANSGSDDSSELKEEANSDSDDNSELKEDVSECVDNEATSDFNITNIKGVSSEIKPEDLGLRYCVHLSKIGWLPEVEAGNPSEAGRIEAIRIIGNSDLMNNIEYSVHVQNIGWMDPVKGNDIAGTVGKSLQIEAIKINLLGDFEQGYNVFYRVYVDSFGWTDWASNGQICGSEGYTFPLKQIEIKILDRNDDSLTNGENPRINDIELSYSAHVQNVGWMNRTLEAEEAGTTGKSLRLEGLIIYLSDEMKKLGHLLITAHVQDYGWLEPVTEGELIGTTGESKRLEAIKIGLTGDLANQYDIIYRSHVENLGWLDWTSNNNPSGSEGKALRMEAIEIKLLNKEEEQSPPPTGEHAFEMRELKNGFFYELINGKRCKVYYDNDKLVKKGFKLNNIYYQVDENTGAIIHEQTQFSNNVYLQGIDISEHNGNIDLSQYQNGFVIIRIGWWTNPDTKAIRNMDLCDKYNIPYGVYLYDYTTEPFEAVQEAEFTLQMIKGRNIRCGVWFDMEDDGWRARNGVAPDHPNISKICQAFCQKIEQAGYHVGIYASYSWFENYITGCDRWDKWVAHWGSNNGNWNVNLSGYCPMHQYTSTPLDKNVMYVDPSYFR